MPNQPSVDNIQRGLRIPRPLDAKVVKQFKVHKQMTVKEAYILALEYATKDVALDVEDYERIAKEKKAAKLHMTERRTAR